MKKVLFVLTFTALFFQQTVLAETARFEVKVNGSGAVLPGGGYETRVLVRKQGGGEVSVGENVEFRVRNARSGDRCDTRAGGTDNNGYAYGGCYASDPGQVTIYAHSVDKGDDSNDVILTFVARAANTPTPAPSVRPTSSFGTNTSPTPEEEETPTPEPTEELSPTPTPEVQGGLLNNGPFMGLLLIILIAAIAGGVYYWRTKKTTVKKITTEPERDSSAIED